MVISAGSRLGSYEITKLLGAGGMGEVYHAKDLRLGRDVAVKVLTATVAASPEWLARFEREARTVAGLNHPNIVTLYTVEDEDGIRFFTMEYVKGRSLDRLVTPGGLPLARVLEVSIPITDALVAAHERGIVHRDLKPANVMVTDEGRVKVLDFGLAKVAAAPKPGDIHASTATAVPPLTSRGEVMGTIPYMSPEQIRGEQVDARSDVFALGILLYELATGSRPFSGETAADVSSSILRDRPKPLHQIRAELSGDFERIVSRCLEKSPQERIQTALDVCDQLRRVGHDDVRTTPNPSLRPPSPTITSVAVLPFVNRGRDENDEYFSDGLADELLDMLTRVPGLRVVARSSAYAFKGRQVTVAEVGRALNVAAVLEGTVRRAAGRVRIGVQLVNVADGYHLWAATYERTLEDIFAVQDDIARSVVGKLSEVLHGGAVGSGPGDPQRIGSTEFRTDRVPRPEAFRLLLQGRYLVGRGRPADLARGIDYLRAAVEIDPGYASAWAQLGGAYATEAGHGAVPSAEGHARALETIRRALELEPDLADAHARMGWLKMRFDWDLRGAEASLRRARELAPGDVATLNVLAVLARIQCRLDEAIDLHRQCCELDPVSSNAHHNLGHAYYAAGRLSEAEGAYRTALELSPQRDTTHALLAVVLASAGQDAAALAEATREPDEASRLWATAIIHGAKGRSSDSDDALHELIRKFGDSEPYGIAQVFATRHDNDSAFDWLERALARRVGALINLRANPRLSNLHSDQRWVAFLQKMGLET